MVSNEKESRKPFNQSTLPYQPNVTWKARPEEKNISNPMMMPPASPMSWMLSANPAEARTSHGESNENIPGQISQNRHNSFPPFQNTFSTRTIYRWPTDNRAVDILKKQNGLLTKSAKSAKTRADACRHFFQTRSQSNFTAFFSQILIESNVMYLSRGWMLSAKPADARGSSKMSREGCLCLLSLPRCYQEGILPHSTCMLQ